MNDRPYEYEGERGTTVNVMGGGEESVLALVETGLLLSLWFTCEEVLVNTWARYCNCKL